jgi:hypothetical protein
MNVTIHPAAVDQLAGNLMSLGLEIEQARSFVARAVRAGEYGTMLSLACKQLAEYQEMRAGLADAVKDIALEFGVLCKAGGHRVLVGSNWVIRQQGNDLTLIMCAEPSAVAAGAAPAVKTD